MAENKLYSDEEIDAILGVSKGLLFGERLAHIRDNYWDEYMVRGYSFERIAFNHVNEKK